MITIEEILKESTQVLQKSEIAEPRREANSLLAFALKKDKTFLIAHPEYELTESEETFFKRILTQRTNREPFQYITGAQEFYGLDFEVNKNVLIPRPETEMIVENAIEILQNLETPTFCEVGTGSGCISISILHNSPNATATGVDISEKALEITKRNAEKHNVLARLDLRISDLYDSLSDEKFELIVSNPPYISVEDFTDLQIEVKDFEPQFALTDNGNGISIIEKIIIQTPNFLKTKGFLLMEIGFNQAEIVRLTFSDKIWQSVEIQPDLQGIPRMVRAQIK